jgi:hypothetical protein
MATICAGCKRTIGFFQGENECSVETCKDIYCDECSETKLLKCDKCGNYLYCAKHIHDHKHEINEYGEEDNMDDEIIQELIYFTDKEISILNTIIQQRKCNDETFGNNEMFDTIKIIKKNREEKK